MKPYDQLATCAKCSSSHNIRTRWCPAVAGRITGTICRVIERVTRKDMSKSAVMQEHMQRICNHCGYTWSELPVDTPSPLAQLAEQAE